jgi:hypothetical protein
MAEDKMENLARSYLLQLLDTGTDKVKFLRTFEVYSHYLPKDEQRSLLQRWLDTDKLSTPAEIE